MSADDQEITKPLGNYVREVGKDVIADIHVHGVLGMAAVLAHKLFSEHVDNEEIAIVVTGLFLAGSVGTWAIRRHLRRRAEKKKQVRIEWTNHL